jgi:hypothetical protein
MKTKRKERRKRIEKMAWTCTLANLESLKKDSKEKMRRQNK